MKVRDSLQAAFALPDGPRRTAALVAWFQSLFPRDRVPVLVGGAAVELYTAGAYTTGDLDFAGQLPAAVASLLEQVGFRKLGRHWLHEAGQVFIELPSSAIAPNETSAILEFEGLRILAVSPEDLIVDRLAAWQFWKSSADGASAYLLWKAQAERLDVTRLDAVARSRHVEKGLSRLRELTLRLATRTASPKELETWARRFP